MRQKPLGQSGIMVPELGLGTWRYHGGPEPLQRGMAAGAAFIDTAESYGTEEVVGAAIRGRRSEVFLASKVSPQHFRRADLIAAADRSLRRLGTDYLDLYQLHQPNASIPIAETMEAMESLVDAGKVRWIGVSNFSVAELQQAQQSMRRYRIVSNQVRYHLADRTIESELLPYCSQQNILIIAYSPLGKELHRIRDCDPKRLLDRIAQETGKTVPQIILNWVLTRPEVVAIPKSNSVERTLENLGASDWRLAAEHHRMLELGIKFRRRGQLELWLRRCIPRSLGRFMQGTVNKLPRGFRRRIT